MMKSTTFSGEALRLWRASECAVMGKKLLQETFNEERQSHLFGAIDIHVNCSLVVNDNTLGNGQQLGVELCVPQMFKANRYFAPGF